MKKITIISPCYNGENYLKPYIEGLLAQNYTNVEYIFVNDGSTDETENIIKSYEKDFINKGWSFTYIYQEKSGQAAAINKGLEIFTGDYLSCIDSDDVLLPTYLKDMSDYLDNNPTCAICFPFTEVIEQKTGKIKEYFKRKVAPDVQDSLFDECLLYRRRGENSIFYPTYMLRSEEFLKICPDRKIYEGKSGQNFQMILPLIYNYKVGYVEKILYRCIARVDSDSRNLATDDLINKSYSWEDIATKTLRYIPNMPDYEKVYYFSKIKEHWQNQRNYWLNCNTQEKPHYSFLEKIFSVKNDKTYKIITVLGIKLKIKRRKNA